MAGQELEQVHDAEIVEAATAAHPSTLFGSDPGAAVEKMTAVADALNHIIRQKRLFKRIHGREHVLVEAWTTLGAMLGVVPVVVWTRELENGWEARVEARTLDGRVVGAAEASCTRDESTWRSRDPYALRSMAQTRATSKALRHPLGFIVTLAGYSSTPAEEMPGIEGAAQRQEPERVMSEEGRQRMLTRFREAGITDTYVQTFLSAAGVTDPKRITESQYRLIMSKLDDHLASSSPGPDDGGPLDDPARTAA